MKDELKEKFNEITFDPLPFRTIDRDAKRVKVAMEAVIAELERLDTEMGLHRYFATVELYKHSVWHKLIQQRIDKLKSEL